MTLTLTIKAADGATTQVVLPAPVINAVGVPVLTPVNFTLPTNPPTTGSIGSIPATNSPTSFQIVSGDPNHYFAIGQHHISPPGAVIPPDGIYNLMVNASNAAGVSAAVPVTITVGKAITLIPATFTPQLPLTVGEVIGTCGHSGGTPVSWAITAGDTSGFFSIDKNGMLTVTAAGVAGLKALTTYSLTLQATNAFGSVSGMWKVSPLTASASASDFPAAGAAIDVKFDTNQVSGGTLTNLFSVSNSGGYAQNADLTWSLFSSNTIRRTSRGALLEWAATSLAASINDLTTGSWTRSNMSAAKNQAGLDGTPNVATLLTATGAGATISQAVTRTGNSALCIAIKAGTVTGNISLSVDGGTTQYPIGLLGYVLLGSTRALDGGYQVLQLPCTANNPTIQLTIANSGDSVVVASFDLQTPSNFAPTYAICGTTPVLTAGGTRTQDQITAAGALATLLQGASGCIVFTVGGMTNPLNSYNGPPSGPSDSPSGGDSASTIAMLWDITNNNAIFSAGTPYSTRAVLNGTALSAADTIGQDFNNPGFANDNGGRTSPIGDGGWHSASKFAFAWDATGCAYSFNGGTVITSSTVPSFSASVLLALNYGGYLQRITAYSSRPTNATVQSRAASGPAQPIPVDQGVTGTDFWTNYTIGQEYPMVTTNAGDSYGVETGQLGAPGGTPSGTYSYIRNFNDTKMQRVVILPGDPVGYGVDSDTVKERRELNGGYNNTGGIGGQPPGKVYAAGQTLWLSYAALIVPGAPILSHDFFSIGQTHTDSGPGQAITLALGVSGAERFQYANDPAAADYGSFTWLRGCWNFFVWRVLIETGATGQWQLWRNGVQAFNQSNIITATGPTLNYEWKYGIYRAPSSETQTVFFANVTQSTSSLIAKVTSPDPIPSGFSYSGAPTSPL